MPPDSGEVIEVLERLKTLPLEGAVVTSLPPQRRGAMPALPMRPSLTRSGERRRGLGEIGKGVDRGLLLHAMLAVDADTYGCLGLVSGRLWTRPARMQWRRRVDHAKRPLADKESQRWLSTAEAAKSVLAAAASITVVADRESDIYAEWA